MTNRNDRLKATQKAYAQWEENTEFTTEYGASDEEESRFIEKLAEVDPQLKENFMNDEIVNLNKIVDLGFQEALEDEYLSRVAEERISSGGGEKGISLDELITQLGFTHKEIEALAESEHGTDLFFESQNLSQTTRERLLLSMDDGSYSLLPTVERDK